MRKIIWLLFLLAFFMSAAIVAAQPDTVILGFGEYDGVTPTASSSEEPSFPENTINQDGYLPNQNAASRFLAQATLGYDYVDINEVSTIGYENWIDTQFTKEIYFSIVDEVKNYHNYVRTETGDPDAFANSVFWRYAYWNYLMKSDDALRQKIALILSEILVISQNSGFGGNPYAIGHYYDILLENAFGNYRDLLEDVTYSPTMGVYLTYMNNPKTDSSQNRFPDENYAREVMQLFTIGTVQLNNDGTIVLDQDSIPVPTYDNEDITEFSKIFTGMTWGDRDLFWRGSLDDTSYIIPMQVMNDYHNPGEKELLNGFLVPDRDPVNGEADIQDALDNLFMHDNTPPFVCKFLIQRLVTSNPPPEYVERVANVFIDNGSGVRGDMKSVIKAILLDPYASSCASAEDIDFGALREPFIRYTQINKAFNANTTSGNYRNSMYNIHTYTGQRPFYSPSVFNFFQSDYQPIGPVEQAGKVAPVFQITDAQTITGYFKGLYQFIIRDNVADEWDLYSGEGYETYMDEFSELDFSQEIEYTDNDKLHILMDRLNLLLAQGRVSDEAIEKIILALKEFENEEPEEKEERVKVAIFLLMTTPEYLINR